MMKNTKVVHWLFLFHTWLILKTSTDLHVNKTLGVGVIQSCMFGHGGEVFLYTTKTWKWAQFMSCTFIAQHRTLINIRTKNACTSKSHLSFSQLTT